MSIGKIIGIVFFAVAVVGIWMWPRAEAPEAPEEILRPVRSCVVKGGSVLPELRFNGKIEAEATRELCFKQTGRIQRIPVNKGQFVKKGEKLAWLFPEDFQNKLETAQAAAERDRLSFGRISDAAKKNAVSKEDVSKTEAQLRQSEANLELARRAWEETTLYAPFDGTVADRVAAELDMVCALDTVVVMQDMSRIRIAVTVPETIVIMQHKITFRDDPATNCCVASVMFDSCPDRLFPVDFLEYTAAADKNTQTYTATYVMSPVDDLLLLPGMSATIVIPAGSYRFDDDATSTTAVDIPEAAVGVDDAGGYFAWKLVREGDVYVAHKTALKGCMLLGKVMKVESGVSVGDRLATAGIAVLTEGRKVTLLED